MESVDEWYLNNIFFCFKGNLLSFYEVIKVKKNQGVSPDF
jgi:hypothetical protein